MLGVTKLPKSVEEYFLVPPNRKAVAHIHVYLGLLLYMYIQISKCYGTCTCSDYIPDSTTFLLQELLFT